MHEIDENGKAKIVGEPKVVIQKEEPGITLDYKNTIIQLTGISIFPIYK